MRFGRRFGQRYHAALVYGAYATTTICALAGLLPLVTLGVWLTFPLAYANVRGVLRATDRRAYITGIEQTSRLHLIFGVALAACILLAALTHAAR